ncbi:hypothetical protein Vretifemale_5546, partial [Volvox reticuliferus]
CLEACQDKGLQIRVVDQAKCSFVDAFFPATAAHGQAPVFSRFDCGRSYFPMWIAPALLGRAIRTATDSRKRAIIGQSFVLHLTVASSDPDHLILEGEMTAGTGPRVAGVVKSTRQDLALLTPTFDASTCFVDGNSFTFTGEALFESPDLLVEILSDVKSSGCEEVTLTLSSLCLQLSGKASDNCSRLQVSLRGCTGTGTASSAPLASLWQQYSGAAASGRGGSPERGLRAPRGWHLPNFYCAMPEGRAEV